jgi:hypothetical protein
MFFEKSLTNRYYYRIAIIEHNKLTKVIEGGSTEVNNMLSKELARLHILSKDMNERDLKN